MISLNCPIKPDLKKLNYYLEEINRRGWYTNFGFFHNELTEKLQDYLGVDNLLLVNNGTSALQVAGKVLATEHILTTPFSFVATASAFHFMGNKLSFADIDPDSFNLCPENVQRMLNRTGAATTVVAAHVYGNPCNVDAYEEMSKSRDIKIIYDAAHAFGVKVGAKSVLKFGDASTLSFHATKVYHTIEGGAVIFRRDSDYERAKSIINFGIDNESGELIPVGTNAKMNEYQAAVGLINLDIIDDVIEHRVSIFEYYLSQLKDLAELPKWHNGANFNAAYMPIRLKNNSELKKVIQTLNEDNIQCRNYFSPSLETIYNQSSERMPISQSVSETILCLPMHASLSNKDVDLVVNSLKKVL